MRDPTNIIILINLSSPCLFIYFFICKFTTDYGANEAAVTEGLFANGVKYSQEFELSLDKILPKTPFLLIAMTVLWI